MKSHLIENSVSRALKLVESKEHRKGCIGRLEGICADFKNPTRNGRLYGLKLWKNVFSNELVKEALETKTLFGELDHPEERFEVLSKLACVVMTDYQINEDDGTVTGGFDILDTVQGRTLKALLDYGSQMGVSSRGTGDIINGSNGEEVDPDTYDFACFDVVSTPAVATARQTVVESLNQRTKRKALLESINSEIKQATSIELEAIENTVKKSKVPNLDSVLESIQDRKHTLKEGKTISSNNLVESEKSIKSAKTIRDEQAVKETIKTVAKLNSKVTAYKNREKATAKMIESLKATINNLTDELNNTKEKLNVKVKECASKSSTNNKLKNELNECKTTLQEYQNKLNEHTIKLTKSKKQINESKRQSKVNEIDLTTKNNRILQLENLNKNYVKKLNDIQSVNQSKITNLNKRLQNSLNAISELTEEKLNLTSVNKSLNEKLSETSSIINSYKDKQQQLKSNICEKQEEVTITENKLTKKYNELADNYNKLLEDSNALEDKVNNCNNVINNLNEQLCNLKNTNDTCNTKINNLSEKLNSVNKLNKAYVTSYLTECATKQGINPKAIKVTESITPTEIKKLITEEKDRQDRYNKLPISLDAPTKVKVLSESVTDNSLTPELSSTISFLEKVQGTI